MLESGHLNQLEHSLLSLSLINDRDFFFIFSAENDIERS